MTPARLSDETLRDYAERFYLDAHPHTTGDIRDMARELLALRARVADTPENVERVARAMYAVYPMNDSYGQAMTWGEVKNLSCTPTQTFGEHLSKSARAALAALAGRGD